MLTCRRARWVVERQRVGVGVEVAVEAGWGVVAAQLGVLTQEDAQILIVVAGFGALGSFTLAQGAYPL